MSEKTENIIKVTKSVVQSICETIILPETGGILGSQNGIISMYAFDPIEKTKLEKYRYTPNIQFLNKKIQEWEQEGIEFSGMIHSHPDNIKNLSVADIIYMKDVMRCNPQIQTLLAPVCVFTEDGGVEINWYKVMRTGDVATLRCFLV